MTVKGTTTSAGVRVPVFPLPSVVFFPRTVLPLHVFEPRYRAMVRDAVAGDGLIAVSLLRPGWEEDYEGSPAFHSVGTLGRIEDLDPLPDGRFLFRLIGMQRVSLGEVVRSEPYRLVEARPLAETSVDENSPEIRSCKLDLLTAQGCLMHEIRHSAGENIVFDERITFEAAVNGACANLPVEAPIRQSLLGEDDLFTRQRRVCSLMDQVLRQVLEMKTLRETRDSGRMN